MRRPAIALVVLLALAGSVTAALLPGGGHPQAIRAQSAPYRTFVPGLANSGQPTFLSVSTKSAYQGGALLVAASRGSSGTVALFGREYPLLPGSAGGLSAFVGVGVLDPAGPTPLTVEVHHLADSPDVFIQPLTILQTAWTVDYITFVPDPNAPPDENPLDPANIAAENQLLADTYAGVTGIKWQGAWLTPLVAPVTGYFGEQRSVNGGPVSGHHGGTDFGALSGTPVAATNAGVVVLARPLIVRGNMVIVDHGGGVFSGYAHLSSIAVTEGEAVAAGQLLGAVGSTGFSTGAHLHWEMSVRGILVDGLRWLDGTQGY